jgi:hypothetical protein
VDTLLIEAVPAVSQRSLAESVQVLRTVVAQDVVLTRHIKNFRGLGGLEHLLHRVEFIRLGKMAQIARVKYEFRRFGQRVDPIDRFLKSANDIRVRGLVETDVGITDLDEIEFRSCNNSRIGQNIPQCPRGENAAGDRADHRRAGPAHAAEKATAVDAIAVGVV